MIQQQTKLRISDNSGARKVKCIKIMGGFKRKTAVTGDVIVVSVQELRSKNRHLSKIQKGDVVRALIIKTRNSNRRKTGVVTKQFENSAILLGKRGNLIGTRILSAIPKTLKKKKLLKYLSLCPGTV